MRKLTTKEFIERASKVHNGKYDYSKVIYVNSTTPIIITCPIHGDFKQKPTKHLIGHGCLECKKDSISRYWRKPQTKFIQEANTIHKNKYNYSNVEYKGTHVHVGIICPKHGLFHQTPHAHLEGQGCPICGIDKQRRCKHDYRNNDIIYSSKDIAYSRWSAIIQRCYFSDNKNYTNCEIIEEWLTYSNFKKWFDKHYVEGWEIDKDILSDKSKIYSPETCCFVPREINSIFRILNQEKTIGVYKQNGKYYTYFKESGKQIYKSFQTKEEAFECYKQYKIRKAVFLAEKYKGIIDDRVYNILSNFDKYGEKYWGSIKDIE